MIAFSQLTYGLEKTKKTSYAASAFEIPDFRVLYLDNHNSTLGLDVPQITTKWSPEKLPTGVLHIGTDTAEIRRIAEGLRAKAFLRRKVAQPPPYDLVVLDDVTEYVLIDIANRTKKARADARDEGKKADTRQAYLTLLDDVCEITRLWMPEETGMSLLYIARAARLRDLLEESNDPNAETVIRPMIRGQFGVWILYAFDMISYQSKKVQGENVTFTMRFKPKADIVADLRAGLFPLFPSELPDPKYADIHTLVQKLERN